jgi:hypothetical protein
MKKISFIYFSILSIFLSINFSSSSLAQTKKFNNTKEKKERVLYQNIPYIDQASLSTEEK